MEVVASVLEQLRGEPEAGGVLDTLRSEGATPTGKKEAYGPARTQSDPHGPVMGGVLDTMGVTDRKGARTATDTILRPQGVGELMTREAVLAPVSLGSLPARVAVQGGLGALERLTAGKGLEDAGYGALIDATVAGLTEGVLGAVGAGARKLAKPLLESRAANKAAQSAFEWATEAPQVALDALAKRFPGAKMLIPSLDETKKLTFQEAIDRLTKVKGGVEGDAYKQARAEIADWMKRLDKQVTPKPDAGAVFLERTEPKRFTPPPSIKGTVAQRSASQVSDIADSGVTRSAADTLATTPADEQTGIPIGGKPIMDAIHSAKDIWHVLKHLHP